MKIIIPTAAIVIVAISTFASADGHSSSAVTTVKSEAGKVIASAKSGMTLYTFRKDATNKSNCYGNCAQSWPPFVAGRDAKASGKLGLIKRKDGARQWTLNGKPLYFWAGDAARGDVSGNGVGGVWDVVKAK